MTRSTFTEVGLSNGTIGIFKQLIYIQTSDEEETEFKKKVQNLKLFPEDTIYIQNPICILLELLEPKRLPEMENLPKNIVPIGLDKQTFNIDLTKFLPSKTF